MIETNTVNVVMVCFIYIGRGDVAIYIEMNLKKWTSYGYVMKSYLKLKIAL